MAQLPTYQSNESVQTGLPGGGGPSASAADFGGITGNGLERLAGGLDDARQAIESKITRDSNIWVQNTISQARLDWSNKLADYHASGNADGLTKQAHDDFEGYANNLLKSAPNGMARELLTLHLNELARSVLPVAKNMEARGIIAARSNSLRQTIQNNVLGIAAPDQLKQVLTKEVIPAYESGLPPGDVDEAKLQAGSALNEATINFNVATRGPTVTADKLENGELLPDTPEMERYIQAANLRSQASADRKVAASVSELGLNDAVEAIKKDPAFLGRNAASVSQLADSYVGSHAGIKGADTHQALYDFTYKIDSAYKVGAVASAMSSAPFGEWSQPEYLRQFPILSADNLRELERDREQRLKTLATDPGKFLQTYTPPVIQKALQDALGQISQGNDSQPADWQSTFAPGTNIMLNPPGQQTPQAKLRAVESWWNEYYPGQPFNLISNDEAKTNIMQLQGLAIQGQTSNLRQWFTDNQRKYGPYFGDVLRTYREAGLPLIFSYMGEAAKTGRINDLNILAQAMAVNAGVKGEDPLLKLVGEQLGDKDIKTSLDNAFAKTGAADYFRAFTSAGMDAGTEENLRNTLNTVALGIVRNSGYTVSLKDAAKQAYDLTIGATEFPAEGKGRYSILPKTLPNGRVLSDSDLRTLATFTRTGDPEKSPHWYSGQFLFSGENSLWNKIADGRIEVDPAQYGGADKAEIAKRLQTANIFWQLSRDGKNLEMYQQAPSGQTAPVFASTRSGLPVSVPIEQIIDGPHWKSISENLQDTNEKAKEVWRKVTSYPEVATFLSGLKRQIVTDYHYAKQDLVGNGNDKKLLREE